jgi:hypothetical protein
MEAMFLHEIELLENILDGRSSRPAKLSLPFLKFITGNFSEEVGSGGYGVVYKVNLFCTCITHSRLSTVELNLVRAQF